MNHEPRTVNSEPNPEPNPALERRTEHELRTEKSEPPNCTHLLSTLRYCLSTHIELSSRDRMASTAAARHQRPRSRRSPRSVGAGGVCWSRDADATCSAKPDGGSHVGACPITSSSQSGVLSRIGHFQPAHDRGLQQRLPSEHVRLDRADRGIEHLRNRRVVEAGDGRIDQRQPVLGR